MDTVQILMSTYNGEKYLCAQLDSILKQTYPSISILIRDDGSSDGTLSILQEYAKKYDNVTYYEGKNVGATQSFLQLLRDSDEHAKYYAFADQDDVWLPKKIARAVEMLEEKQANGPALYCSDAYVTDENLNIIKKDDKNPRPSFGNALVQNICTGCTAVMNKELRDIINRTKPVNIVMHDWWFYLSGALHGKVVYDQESYIYYRQHGHNEWGAMTSKWHIFRYRIKQLFKKRGYIFAQNEELVKAYSNMETKKRKLLELVQKSQYSIMAKLRLAVNRDIYRNKREDDVVYRLIVLIGKL